MPNRRKTPAWKSPASEQPRITAHIEREIDNNQTQLIRDLGEESIEVYCFLSREYCRQRKNGAVEKDPLFQFVYRSYYRLDNAGLTDAFKTRYFTLMERTRLNGAIDLSALAKDLRPIRTRRGFETVQFSFITKLAATVSDDYPIYDREVGKVFGFSPPDSIPDWDARLERYLEFYAWLRSLYGKLLSGTVIPDAITTLKAHYPNAKSLHDMKVLDFLFWQAGKLEIVAVP